MRSKKTSIKTFAIILLIGIIICLININTKNSNIKKQDISKEKLDETTSNNMYVSMSTHLSELDSKQQEINNIQNIAGRTTVTEDKILKNYTAYKDGKLITGTMTNNGAVTKALNAGGSYTIPAGYHNGNGKVTANSLASQTSATATAAQILKGQTAWVNGSKITGTMINNAFPSSFTTVISSKVSNSTSSVNQKTGEYTATKDGIIAYSIASANDNGSYISVKLNGNSICYQNNPINLASGCIKVSKGDYIYMDAYGYKGTTSNASAYIMAVFGAY